MILKDYYALCYAKFAYFGAKDKNVNEDRPSFTFLSLAPKYANFA